MRRPLRFRRLGWSLVLLSLFTASRGLSQDYETPFKNGMRARDNKDWKAAITYFSAAADARPGEGLDRVGLYGMRSAPYLPHYYLGEAYANSGNCVTALVQFDESERQGFVQKAAGLFRSLRNLQSRCQGLVGQVVTPRLLVPALTPTAVSVVAAPPTAVAVVVPPTQIPQPRPTENALAKQSLREAQTEVARAEAMATEETRLRKGSIKSGTWQKDPSLEKKNKTATDDLAAARTALEEGRARGDVSKLRVAHDLAVRANQAFGDLQRLLLDKQRIAGQVTAAPPSLPRDVNNRVSGARQLLADAGRNPLPAEAAAPKANLERLLREVQRLPSAAPSEIKAFDDRLKIATSSLSNALRPKPSQTPAAVPPPLLEGASAYFAGDYAKAAQTLAAAPDFPDRRAAAEARLFRSAARYALYVIGGAKDGNLQRSALQDASDCRRLDPQVSPNRKVFSPRFVQFFTQVTASGADH